jgi:DNA-binding CsgD family transcriptional regulator
MESRKSQRSSSSGLGNSMRIEMNANSFPTSKAVVQKRETLPIAAEDGIIMTDLSLKPIAIDRGATAILTDIGRYENSTDLTRLPREVMAALQDTDLHHLSAFRFRVRGERQTYDCRAYLLEPRQRATVSPFLTLYFRRISSPGDAIRRLSAECNLTPREEEVLMGISIGLTSKELGERLSISPNTVKAFLRLIMIKLGVTTRAAIVGRLLEYGSSDAE